MSKEDLRTPIVCVLGHVDHGKTTFLDLIRGSNVAGSEAGEITQHIGATEITKERIESFCKPFRSSSIDIPGLLFIDTPGHHSFISLRRRGGSLADIAILIVDITEGFRPQTFESLEILKRFKTPFVVAANKVDRIEGWNSSEGGTFVSSYKKQTENVRSKFDELLYELIGSLYDHGFSSDRYDHIRDFKKNVSVVPMSAKTGEGIPDLILMMVGLAQRFLGSNLHLDRDAQGEGIILDKKEEKGLGTTVDIILYNGKIMTGDTIVVGSLDTSSNTPIVTTVRGLLKTLPLVEMSARSKFKSIKEVTAAAGIKVSAAGLEAAGAGLPILVVDKKKRDTTNLEEQVKEMIEELTIKVDEQGIVVKADTLGTLEGVVNEFRMEEIPIVHAHVGDITRRDLLSASLNENELFRAVVGFNVKMRPEVKQSEFEVRLFQGKVIYELLDEYKDWTFTMRQLIEKRQYQSIIRPGKIHLIPDFVFRQSKPAVVGVRVLGGILKNKVYLINREGRRIGHLRSIEDKGETIPSASMGSEVAVSIDGPTVGRQINSGDILYVDIPESHSSILEDELNDVLSQDELEALEEFLKIKRKGDPFWGRG